MRDIINGEDFKEGILPVIKQSVVAASSSRFTNHITLVYTGAPLAIILACISNRPSFVFGSSSW